MQLFPEERDRYVSVAVPVPLRRVFTYRVPHRLGSELEPGVRVAVPFGGRKLAGVVLGPAEAPGAETRVKDVAGVLDDRALFDDELLGFLAQAADYYLHPIGEVLRAAAPALPSEALRALRSKGFLARGETLRGERVATRTVRVVRLTPDRGEPGKLGKNQGLLYQLMRERGEVSFDELKKHVKNVSAVVRALAQKGLVVTSEREVARDRFFADAVERLAAPEPNAEQAAAISALVSALGRGGGFLLRGVTGSGKTEVYLRLIAEARARGQGALMLVPEIALTPQLVWRFRARFGDEIAVLHSELSPRERNDAWRDLRGGRVSLAIGARSALFAPVQNLGVVVVDEEHDGSFKQEEGFRYHARDMALLRAHRAGAVCVLGSATPSLESHELARQGRLGLLTLAARATAQELPPVEVVDLARHRSGPSGHRLITQPLHRAIEECLGQGEQAILFLNRRGFAPSLRCTSCDQTLECPACSVALTMHKGARVLRCHYCDFTTPNTGVCIQCGAPELLELGIGTEQLEQDLSRIFPSARVARLDRDTAAGVGVEAVLERLRAREVDILVGTQMVTKGHDLPGVTVVGVILADQSLAFPDFRASERTFQLLAQVGGRAGRGDRPGKVIIQTYQPGHPAVECARTHDYLAFCKSELGARGELSWPPFSRLVAIRIDAAELDQAERAARELAELARTVPAVRAGEVSVLGPALAPIARLRGRHRVRMLLKAARRPRLREVALVLRERIEKGLSPARATLDVDPVSML